MSGLASPRLRHYAVLAALLMLAGLATGRAEPVALAAPLLVFLAAGLLLGRTPRLDTEIRLEKPRLTEGETAVVKLDLDFQPRPYEVELAPPQVPGLRWTGGERLLRPAHGRLAERLELRAERWGGHRLDTFQVRAHDRLGLFTWRGEVAADEQLRVYPPAEAVRRLALPLETQPGAGAIRSRARGEGLEFAEVRPYQPGDHVRRINWRASGRRSALMVNEHHPDRSSDVVLFVDAFSELEPGVDSPLVAVVRLAAAIAQAHLRRRDRVGVVGFGGVVRWLQPGSGTAQVYRVLDALIDTRARLSYAWKGLTAVPPRTLPAHAQVLAVTSLTDERTTAALESLAARGYDLSVIEVGPPAYLPPADSEPERRARRVYEMRRAVVRDRFFARGVAVAGWMPGRPVESLLAEIEEFRRAVRLRRQA